MSLVIVDNKTFYGLLPGPSPPPPPCPVFALSPSSGNSLGIWTCLSCFISIPQSRKKLPHCHATLFQRLSPTLFRMDRQERRQTRLVMRLTVIISNTLPFKSGNHNCKLNANDSHIYCQSPSSLALNFSNFTLCFPSRYKMITGNIKV